MYSSACRGCGYEIPLFRNFCPHCGRHTDWFPNVWAAQSPSEVAALEQRYKRVWQDAASRGASIAVEGFEVAITRSKAVIARPFRELDRLASSDKELFYSYYKLLGAEVRLPHGNQWDNLRSVADEVLFPGYKGEIRFAALSLDGLGLSSYGDCSFVLRDDMIAHRASVFEENSAVFLKKHSYDLPPGHRAPWSERAKLCIAKLGHEIATDTTPDRFASILLRAGVTRDDDDFVEVHIWGPLSARSCERVFWKESGKYKKAFRLALRDRFRKVGVELEEIS